MAGGAAAAAFFLISWFCWLWNRHFVYTVWHRVSFTAASLLAFIAVLVWPASANLEAAVQRRVVAWNEHLFQPETVPMDQAWKNTLKQIGVPVIPEKTSWFLALPLRTRDYFRKSGRPEGTIILEDLEHSAQSGYEKWEPTYSFPGYEDEHLYFCFSEAIHDFSLMYPYLGSRLDFDFTGRFEDDKEKKTFLDYRADYGTRYTSAFDRKSGRQVTRITDRNSADALAFGINNRLVPTQTKWIAEWTRKVGVVIPIVFIGLPLMISGVVSYLQIRVGHGRRKRGSSAGSRYTKAVRVGTREHHREKRRAVGVGICAILAAAILAGVIIRKKRSNITEKQKIAGAQNTAPGGNSGPNQSVSGKTAPGEFARRLGLKFEPVPGTKILMCIHELRNKDYAAYAEENSGFDMSWKNVEFPVHDVKHKIEGDDSNHPVVNVSWNDATAFCAWLSQKDGHNYRLPTDHEWSCAVGVAAQEEAGKMPAGSLLKKLDTPDIYPWGEGYPPPRNSIGNYADSARVQKETGSTYTDGHILTAPVMSYPPNQLGLYDLGGNVWEWCRNGVTELYNAATGENVPVPGDSRIHENNTQRGGSFGSIDAESLLSSERMSAPSGSRSPMVGFRIVMERATD